MNLIKGGKPITPTGDGTLNGSIVINGNGAANGELNGTTVVDGATKVEVSAK